MRLWRVGLCRLMYAVSEGDGCRRLGRGLAARWASAGRRASAVGIARDVEGLSREAACGQGR
jgi:hypothetical protein